MSYIKKGSEVRCIKSIVFSSDEVFSSGEDYESPANDCLFDNEGQTVTIPFAYLNHFDLYPEPKLSATREEKEKELYKAVYGAEMPDYKQTVRSLETFAKRLYEFKIRPVPVTKSGRDRREKMKTNYKKQVAALTIELDQIQKVRAAVKNNN